MGEGCEVVSETPEERRGGNPEVWFSEEGPQRHGSYSG